jgi:hypothetical protein
VARAHIAAQTTKDERTRFMGYAGAVQFIGFGLMPGANIMFSDVDVYALSASAFHRMHARGSY